MRAPCSGTMTCEKKPSVPRVRVLLGALALFSLLPGCRWQRVTAQPGAAAGIRFLDATGAAGIHFRHTHGGFGRKLIPAAAPDRKSTRLNSSHTVISYAVFCLKKKNSTGGDNSP